MPASDHSNLMEQIGMNDSFDSSSEDIIPMQRTSRNKRTNGSARSYPRRRNNRGLSAGGLFKTNYRYGAFTLLKLSFFIFTIASLILCLALLYNLYSRFEIIQESLDRVKSSKSSTPEELHEIHSHLQMIDQNITQNKANLASVIQQIANLTSDIATIQQKLSKVLTFEQEAPGIAKLPANVEELTKIVAELGSKMSTAEKEVKLTGEQQAKQRLSFDSIDARVKSLEGNLTNVADRTNSKFTATVSTIQSDLNKLNAVVSNVSATLDGVSKSQDKLDQWRLAIDSQVSELKQQSSSLHNPVESGIVHPQDVSQVSDEKHAVKKELEERPSNSSSSSNISM